MDGWTKALLLKPLIGLALIAAYYFFIIKFLRWLYRVLPKHRFVDALFRERGKKAPDYGPDYEHGSVVNDGRQRGGGASRELQ